MCVVRLVWLSAWRVCVFQVEVTPLPLPLQVCPAGAHCACSARIGVWMVQQRAACRTGVGCAGAVGARGGIGRGCGHDVEHQTGCLCSTYYSLGVLLKQGCHRRGLRCKVEGVGFAPKTHPSPHRKHHLNTNLGARPTAHLQ